MESPKRNRPRSNGYDKAGVGDVWYASAVTTANAVIDEWKRVNDK